MKSIKLIFSVLVLFSVINSFHAQNSEYNNYYQQSTALINQFFSDMKANNLDAVTNAFDPDATIEIVDMRGDKTTSKMMKKEEFVNNVQQMNTNTPGWDEQLQRFQMNMSDKYVSVNVPYIFKINNVKSHCGINNFHLIQNAQGEWKIQYISSSMRNCTNP